MPLKYLLLIPLWVAAWSGLHYYLWRRLARDTGLPRRWRRAAVVAVFAFAIAVPSIVAWNRVASGAASMLLAWPAFIWMGTLLYTVMALGLIDLVRFVIRRIRKPTTDAVDRGRREFAARLVAGAAVTAAGGMVTLGHRASAAHTRDHATQLYVHRGSGYWGPPIRGVRTAGDRARDPSVRVREARIQVLPRDRNVRRHRLVFRMEVEEGRGGRVLEARPEHTSEAKPVRGFAATRATGDGTRSRSG